MSSQAGRKRARSAAAAGSAFDLVLLERRFKVRAGQRGLLAAFARCFDAAPISAAAPHLGTPSPLAIRRAPPAEAPAMPQLSAGRDGGLAGTCGPGGRGVAELANTLVQWAVERAELHYVLHAGAVVRQGRAILLPAGSGGGKSTLTVALALQGFAILSDEAAPIEIASGRVTACARSLVLRRGSMACLGIPPRLGAPGSEDGSRVVRAAELGLRRGGGGRPALIVFPDFARGNAATAERLSAAEAAMALLSAGCSQPRFKAVGLDFLLGLARELPCYRLTYSDAKRAAAVVSALFAEAAGRSGAARAGAERAARAEQTGGQA